ncbi:DUF4202 domain-containing protein [Ferrimonas pelagia]|uniref:DUF4202 domain-containing protein n=1 Tax=Ferrimonas pelagia TaxID=1177826 RepID=A0ABP9ECQ6_9GAMM
MSQLELTLLAIDALHAQDPTLRDGQPAELLYAQRMTRWLKRLAPQGSAELQIAVRSQHLCRWSIPRSTYPMGRTGYLQWRTELAKLHADKALAVMAAQGFDEAAQQRTARIIRKQGIKRDAEVQLLEDCACLVFIEHDFLSFSARHEEAKLIAIVQKTWGKMSERAQQQALQLDLPPEALALVAKALA